MSDFDERLVRQIRGVLDAVGAGRSRPEGAARALSGIAAAIDGSVQRELRAAARTLANDLEAIAYGGAAGGVGQTTADSRQRFEDAIKPDGVERPRDIREH